MSDLRLDRLERSIALLEKRHRASVQRELAQLDCIQQLQDQVTALEKRTWGLIET